MALFTAILNLLAKLGIPVMSWVAGRSQAQKERLRDENAEKEKAIDIQRKQLDIAAEPAPSDDAVLDWLRGGDSKD